MRNQSRTRRSWFASPPILSRRFGIIVFLTMIMWTYTLFTFALYRTEPDVPESVKLKEQILELSKQYVKALSDEQGAGEGKNLPEAYSSYDLKKTMAVLLDSILERLGKLEKKVDHAISNGTQNLLRNISSGLHQDGVSMEHKDGEGGGGDGMDSKEAVNKAKELVGGGVDCSLTEAELGGFSSCKAKVAWMRQMWKSDSCYAQYGVDGTECSFRVYLSEVENWCPRVKGRDNISLSLNLQESDKAEIRLEKQGLFNLMQEPSKFRWIKTRISRMWDTMWVPAAEEFRKIDGDKTRVRKKILVHIGALTKESGFKIADNAFNGGPLGELVQWSDILSTLHILGHDIEISTATTTLGNLLRRKGLTNKMNCPVKGKNLYDLVYIDIVGMKQLKKTIGGQWQQFSCILRVIDSFGTEPAYNVDVYIKKAGTKSSWGNWNLVPRQFFTMFPHTPDNSFMGFVVDHQMDTTKADSSTKRTNRALVYGKSAKFWTDPWIRRYLDKIHKKFEIHGTVFMNQTTPAMKNVIPDYVVNHGIVSGAEIQNLLKETKLFIGLGFPYEGPAPLEAVANGCVFLNPKFNPPKNYQNTKFFQGKPTSRALTSQHPYTEVYIGQPHVWTVDVLGSELDVALDKIAAMNTTTPYLPFEFTCHGMLERVSSYLQKQEFCTGEKQWPPLSTLQIKVSGIGQSCRDRCMEEDLICEPGFFKQLNSRETVENATAVKCSSAYAVEEIYAPAMESTLLSTKCYTQAHHLLYSCAGGGSNHKRVCPCRDYIRGQVALCKECRGE
ncbi:alpha-1,6-mannosylglycoprotein 6-beta-N-acetylglucosaminyltransferase A isoform X2 [Strongylocentrotus purpuratus]|uniref:alpha-1,6-mannosyl-glycoprotein 6-beta-N-acetylglucosaminyltransferase n=1 Tax=Strongylocentrotus purpuratus TaxID=7668 RepID=A0A7M7N4W3_STRPU|nr:alpha-1,6-mannosylglycoprotein 6-beta-N-acetylglucosaminyltransferase A isoform X2 [Strongylocentrotus purpuratus]